MSQQSATFYTYINSGVEALVQSRSGTSGAYLNTGVEALVQSRSGTSGAYLNTGMLQAQETTVIRQPRGWGILPAGPQTIVFKTEQAKATTYAYENTTP